MANGKQLPTLAGWGSSREADVLRLRSLNGSFWSTAGMFTLQFAAAVWVSAQTIFPDNIQPTYSAAAGLCCVYVARSPARTLWLWFGVAVLALFGARTLVGLPLAPSVPISLAIGVEGLVLRALLTRSQLGPAALSFESGHAIVRVLAIAVVASATGAALLTLALVASGMHAPFMLSVVRAVADLTGIVTMAPLTALSWARLRGERRRLAELAVSSLATFAALHLGFVASERYHVYPYLPLVVLMLAVVRCGQLGAVVLPVLWAPLSIWYTRHDLGPWVTPGQHADLGSMLGAQFYNLISFGGAWLVAAIVIDRELARAALEGANLALESRVAERTAEMKATIGALHEERAERQRADARFQELFSRAASPMLIVDPDSGAIIQANAAAAQYYGWDMAQLTEMSICDINMLSGHEVQVVMSRARELERNSFEFRHRRANGDIQDVEVHSSPIVLDKRTLLYSIVQDVTEAKQAERALRDSELRFRSAFDQAPVAMVAISLDPENPGRYLRANQAYCDIIGFSLEELLKLRSVDITHPDDQAMEAAYFAQVAAGDRAPQRFEKRYVRKDGRIVWVRVNGKVLLDVHAKPYGLAHIEDVTERKESQALMDLVFDTCIDPLCTMSCDGYILRSNPAWAHTLGWNAEELSGRPFIEFVHPDDLDRSVEAMRTLCAQRVVIGFENRFRCRDGSYRWFQWNSAPLRDRRIIVASVRDVTARKQAEAEMAHRALHDALTGLPNRQLFHDRLFQSLLMLGRQSAMVAVYYIDLDRFKEINDTFGHENGDRVLVEVSRRLLASVRTVDTVARLAGDEFVIVCPDIKLADNFVLLAERLVSALREPMELNGVHIELGASVGVAITASASTTPEQLLREADAAMYEVKHRGRHGWLMYNPRLQSQSLRRTQTQGLLRDALERGGLRLYYQPIVDLADCRIVAVEALLRLAHPSRGLLAPHEFIEVAEESEMILSIGEWVLKEACSQAVVWNRKFGPLGISVNVSGRQASARTLTKQVVDQLGASALDPQLLCLEVTERVLIDSGSDIISDLRKLTSLGVHLALDDFGTGYSSLTYLKRFPIDTVKIDRSFVEDLACDRYDSAIVKAITSLAANLHLSTIAEGVEHPGQIDGLRELSCQRAQGFVFSRPVPAEELTHLLEQPARLLPPSGRPNALS